MDIYYTGDHLLYCAQELTNSVVLHKIWHETDMSLVLGLSQVTQVTMGMHETTIA